MPRPPRIEYAGAVYHVTSRGNGRQVIFHTRDDRERFLDQLQDNLITFDVVLHAFVLMSNHYHLLVRTNRANLSKFVQRLNTSYGLYYRYKHDKPGHVFQGRYTAKLVDGEEYLLRLTRYIHLNPIKTKTIQGPPVEQQVEKLESYAWSSYPGYVNETKMLPWADYRILKGYGRSWREARLRYRAYVRAMVSESDEGLRETQKASAFAIGDDAFIHEVEKKLRSRRQGDDRDRDIALPKTEIDFDVIERVVAQHYKTSADHLKKHGHVGGEAKLMGLELSARLTGQSQREIGRYFGGISASAVSMMRRKFRSSSQDLHTRLEKLVKQIHRIQ